MPTVERYRDVAVEYAERCVRALVGNDLRAALRAATIANAAYGTIEHELRYQDRARELRARWEAEDQEKLATSRSRGLAIAR
jgi:predicted membrane chloride channel (bestrophin family)